MYKKLLTALFAVVIFASVSTADFVRVEGGAGIWVQEPSQTVVNHTTTYNTEGEAYAWAFVKHFVPMIPNLRVEYATATANERYEFTQIEVIPYYNILDNTGWITLDLGLDLKNISLERSGQRDDFVLPLGYVRARAQLPLSGLGAEADVKYISYDDNIVYDARIKLDYTFEVTPLVQPGLEIGYRVQKLKTNELFNQPLNFKFSGIYAGAMIRF